MDWKEQLRQLESVKQVWHWWLYQLRLSVPTPLHRFFFPDSGSLNVIIEPEVTRFELNENGKVRLAGAVDILTESSESLAQKRDEILGDIPDGIPVQVVLPDKLLLIHDFFLPLATEANIKDVLNFELDRLTPFNRDQVSFGYLVMGRYPETDKLRVRLFVLTVDNLKLLLRKMRSLGLSPNQLLPTLQPEQDSLSGQVNLMPENERPTTEPLWNREAKQYLVLITVLVLVILILPAFLLNRSETSLESEIAEVGDEARIVGQKQTELAMRLAAQEALVTRKNNAPETLLLLRELTAIIPENTWVNRMTINRKSIEIQGESTQASDLIALLEKSSYFQNVAFDSSVTRSPTTGMERYAINMDVVNVPEVSVENDNHE